MSLEVPLHPSKGDQSKRGRFHFTMNEEFNRSIPIFFSRSKLSALHKANVCIEALANPIHPGFIIRPITFNCQMQSHMTSCLIDADQVDGVHVSHCFSYLVSTPAPEGKRKRVGGCRGAGENFCA